MADNWIQASGVSKNKGGLHRALGVPSGEKIPSSKLSSALKSANPHLRHMARFAANVKGLGGRKKTKRLFGR
jgi:hypothetical protein